MDPAPPPGGQYTSVPPQVKALYVPPRPQQRRPALPATYRLRLERETDGAVLHTWSGIPHDKVGPVLKAMSQYLPFFAKAAAAKEAVTRLIDLFR